MADADPSHETLVPSPQSRSSAFDAERPQTVDRGGNFLAARERQITGYALGNQPLESALSDLHLNQTKQFANRTHAVHQPGSATQISATATARACAGSTSCSSVARSIVSRPRNTVPIPCVPGCGSPRSLRPRRNAKPSGSGTRWWTPPNDPFGPAPGLVRCAACLIAAVTVRKWKPSIAMMVSAQAAYSLLWLVTTIVDTPCSSYKGRTISARGMTVCLASGAS